MRKVFLDNRKAFSVMIAIYQMIGGIIGFILIYRLLGPDATPGVIFAVIPLLVITLVSVFAGLFYFLLKNKLSFYVLSKLNFCLQLLQFALVGFSFVFYYGPYLAIGFDSDYDFLFRFEMLTVNLGLKLGNVEYQYAMLNLVPIAFLVILRWFERNPETKGELENAFLENQ